MRTNIHASLLAVLLVATTASALAVADKFKEPVTGTMFDTVIPGDSGRELTLIGAGCRKKTAFGVKVYAIAHWIDAKAGAEALGTWRGQTGEQVAKSQPFYDALSQGAFEKRLQLVFVRDVPAKKMRDAFTESLKLVYDDLPAVATQFVALFQKDVDNHETMELRSLPDGTIEARQGGAKLGTLGPDPRFADAVWRIYFNKKLPDGHLEDLKPELVAQIGGIW